MLDQILVQQWHLSNWRLVPGSGEGSQAVREAADVLVTARAIGPWGIPMHRLTICCGGSGFTLLETVPAPGEIADDLGDRTSTPPPPPPPPPPAYAVPGFER
ncbi:hypothetical protein [Pseudopontixanthobacter vadosimaris]|uniref:hypothetical protein n=1 Tax=Pseudopontixanthobacter vadosimaris TaxID=2726450 RepID=UPI00147673FD|nr:hypothetical protein [Pseudopontixanthobacter vadosimaris]